MQARKAILAAPLSIDVARIASFFPEFRYRGPIPKDFISKAITSEYILNDADHDRFGVLFFDDKTDGGFTTITSYYSPKELAILFTRLPDELASSPTSALRGTDLEIPSLSLREHEEMKMEFEAREARFEILRSVQGPIKNPKRVDFKSQEAVTVLQHEYAVTDANSEQPVLGTFGAGPCVILALYDEQNKKAVLAHIDAMTNIYSLSALISQVSPEHTVAHLAGGYFSSQDMCIEILERLREFGVKVVNADLVRSGFDSASMAIDARTGAIYAPVQHHQLNKTPDIDIRLQMAGFQFGMSPLKRCYNGLSNPRQTSMNLRGTEAVHSSPFSDVRLSDLPLPLGFLSSAKSQLPKPAQSQTFCGLRPGFLNQ